MARFDFDKLATELYQRRMGRTKAEQLGLRQVARRTGVSTSTLSRMEQGNSDATIEHVLAVVTFLGKTLNDYVTNT